MRTKPLFSCGCKIARQDSATYAGNLRRQDVWISASNRCEAAVLVNREGYSHEILPRPYLLRLVGILASGFLFQGLEDHPREGKRQVVFQRWRCQLPAFSDGNFDRDGHPRIARALNQAGLCLSRDL